MSTPPQRSTQTRPPTALAEDALAIRDALGASAPLPEADAELVASWLAEARQAAPNAEGALTLLDALDAALRTLPRWTDPADLQAATEVLQRGFAGLASTLTDAAPPPRELLEDLSVVADAAGQSPAGAQAEAPVPEARSSETQLPEAAPDAPTYEPSAEAAISEVVADAPVPEAANDTVVAETFAAEAETFSPEPSAPEAQSAAAPAFEEAPAEVTAAPALQGAPAESAAATAFDPAFDPAFNQAPSASAPTEAPADTAPDDVAPSDALLADASAPTVGDTDAAPAQVAPSDDAPSVIAVAADELSALAASWPAPDAAPSPEPAPQETSGAEATPTETETAAATHVELAASAPVDAQPAIVPEQPALDTVPPATDEPALTDAATPPDALAGTPADFTSDAPPSAPELAPSPDAAPSLDTAAPLPEVPPAPDAEPATEPPAASDPTQPQVLDPTQPQLLDPTQPQALDPTLMGGPAELTPEQIAAMMAEGGGGSSWGTTPLTLSPEKAELLQFMVTDLKDAAEQIEPILAEATNMTQRAEAAEALRTIAEVTAKTCAFFEFASLSRLVGMLQSIAAGLSDVGDALWPELHVRARAVASLIGQHARGLEVGMETTWMLDTLERRIATLLTSSPLAPSIRNWHRGEVERVLELDKVTEGIEPVPEESDTPAADAQANADAASGGSAGTSASAGQGTPAPGTPTPGNDAPTVRVEAALLERLLGTLGQIVQTKNRVRSLTHRLLADPTSRSRLEDLANAADTLDRLTGDLQVGFMQTRLVPLSKLFDRFPRVIRDVARLADKDIEIDLAGGDTRVDRAVFDALGEPLQQVLRFAASKAIETPDQRRGAGKPPQARIALSAASQGAQVVITVQDDGAGFDAQRVAADFLRAAQNPADAPAPDAPAIAPDAPADAPALSDSQILAALLDADCAASPVAGLLDSLVRKIGAKVQLSATPGVGCRIEITVALRAAIIPAVMVGVGAGIYAVPLQTVTEITRPEPQSLSSVGGRPCLRLREHVLGVIDLRRGLAGMPGHAAPPALDHALALATAHADHQPADHAPADTRACAVITRVGDQRGALLVDRIIGKQEIVVAPLDAEAAGEGPFDGATIRDDGGVSLILDVKRLLSGELHPPTH